MRATRDVNSLVSAANRLHVCRVYTYLFVDCDIVIRCTCTNSQTDTRTPMYVPVHSAASGRPTHHGPSGHISTKHCPLCMAMDMANPINVRLYMCAVPMCMSCRGEWRDESSPSHASDQALTPALPSLRAAPLWLRIVVTPRQLRRYAR